MSSTANKNNSQASISPYELTRRKDSLASEFPYQLKQLKQQILDFLKMDKKLSRLHLAAESKKTPRALNKYEGFLEEYSGAYSQCLRSIEVLKCELDDIMNIYASLSDYYSENGKRRDEKKTEREGAKFEQAQKKNIREMESLLRSAGELDTVMQEEAEVKTRTAEREAPKKEEPVREEEDTRRAPRTAREGQQNYRPMPPPSPGYVYYDPYRMMPPYYQQPGISIAPVSIDVNRAVDSAMASFVKIFESNMESYFEELDKSGLKDKMRENSEVLDKISEDNEFALEKLAGMLERMGTLLKGVSELEKAYGALEEKFKAQNEAAKSVGEAQRALSRELQGIAATQKVISGDTAKLVEEEKTSLEARKSVLEGASKLREAQGTLADEFKTLLASQTEFNEAMKGIISAQAAVIEEQQNIIKNSSKLSDMQKSLTEKQTALTELQKEALAANKKLTRTQRALNERAGARTPAKESASEVAEEIIEVAEAEAPVENTKSE